MCTYYIMHHTIDKHTVFVPPLLLLLATGDFRDLKGRKKNEIDVVLHTHTPILRNLTSFSLFLWLFGGSVGKGGVPRVHSIAGTKDRGQSRPTVTMVNYK